MAVEPFRMGNSGGMVLGEFLLVSLKKQWAVYRKKLRHCQKDLSEETVHEFRIATRRLLSILKLLKGIVSKKDLQEANRDLKKRFKLVGPMRDTHTQILYVSQLCRAFSEARAYSKAIEKRERRLAKRVGNKLSHCKNNDLAEGIAAIKRQIRDLISRPAKGRPFECASERVRSAYASAVECYYAIEPTDLRTIHRTRVAFKWFRYMMEALQPLLPGMTRHKLKVMHRYQTRMGDIQDLEVLFSGIDEFMKKQGRGGKGWERFRGELAQRRAALVQRFMASADELFAFNPLKSLRSPLAWRPPKSL